MNFTLCLIGCAVLVFGFGFALTNMIMDILGESDIYPHYFQTGFVIALCGFACIVASGVQ